MLYKYACLFTTQKFINSCLANTYSRLVTYYFMINSYIIISQILMLLKVFITCTESYLSTCRKLSIFAEGASVSEGHSLTDLCHQKHCSGAECSQILGLCCLAFFSLVLWLNGLYIVILFLYTVRWRCIELEKVQ